jgi:hypothetical protein
MCDLDPDGRKAGVALARLSLIWRYNWAAIRGFTLAGNFAGKRSGGLLATWVAWMLFCYALRRMPARMVGLGTLAMLAWSPRSNARPAGA